LSQLQALAKETYLDPKLAHYIVDIIQATRDPQNSFIQFGSSPRGSLALAISAKAMALTRGRTYVVPEDVEALIHDCLRHRIILSYEGLAEGLTPDKLLDEICQIIQKPILTGV
jgi:MoxR-like ATPase